MRWARKPLSPPSRLLEAEHMMWALYHIPQVHARLQVLLVRATMPSRLAGLCERVVQLERGCAELLGCDELERLLGLVRTVCNMLNRGSPCKGFPLSALNDVADTKGT